jgi:hypothetical protein
MEAGVPGRTSIHHTNLFAPELFRNLEILPILSNQSGINQL